MSFPVELCQHTDEDLSTHKVYVVWSGGADSTTVLSLLAERMEKLKKPIYTLSFTTEFLTGKKIACESYARQQIRKKLKDVDIRDITVDIKSNFLHVDKPDYPTKGSQYITWMTYAMLFVDCDGIIFTGDCEADHIWHEKQTLLNYEYSLNYILDKNITISRPLEYSNKTEILSYLHRKNLLEDVWTCELPNQIGVRCKECTPCKEQLMALLTLYHSGNDWAADAIESIYNVNVRH